MTEPDKGSALPKKVLNTDNVAALLDLKAEFIQRKNQARRDANSSTVVRNAGKNSVLSMTKKEAAQKEERNLRRSEKLRREEAAILKEEAERQRQKKVLEEKALIYERLSSGEQLVNEDGREVEFLVNFNMKKRELEEREEEKIREESGKKKSRFDRDYQDEPEPLIVRYDPAEEPGRVLGASHIPLPKNEDERAAKIKELKEISKQTEQLREKRKKVLDAKKRAEREKLKRYRARLELSPLSSTSEEESEEEDVPGPSISDIPLPPVEKPKNQTEYGIREWDREKFGYKRWKEAEEEKRDHDFAPPSSYFR